MNRNQDTEGNIPCQYYPGPIDEWILSDTESDEPIEPVVAVPDTVIQSTIAACGTVAEYELSRNPDPASAEFKQALKGLVLTLENLDDEPELADEEGNQVRVLKPQTKSSWFGWKGFTVGVPAAAVLVFALLFLPNLLGDKPAEKKDTTAIDGPMHAAMAAIESMSPTEHHEVQLKMQKHAVRHQLHKNAVLYLKNGMVSEAKRREMNKRLEKALAAHMSAISAMKAPAMAPPSMRRPSTLQFSIRLYRRRRAVWGPSEDTKEWVSVRSTPSGASVIVDGKKVGITPLRLSPDLFTAKHTVKLRRQGYSAVVATVSRTGFRLAVKRQVGADN